MYNDLERHKLTLFDFVSLLSSIELNKVIDGYKLFLYQRTNNIQYIYIQYMYVYC